MQTFTPYPSFRASAAALDYRRLGKQRVEARQILAALRGESKAYRNHPATLMWEGYEPWLIHYGNVMIREWIRRGYKNTMEIMKVPWETASPDPLPPWRGGVIHSLHRAHLLHKAPEFYGKYDWAEQPDRLMMNGADRALWNSSARVEF